MKKTLNIKISPPGMSFCRRDYPPKSAPRYSEDDAYITDFYEHDEIPSRLLHKVTEEMENDYFVNVMPYDSGSDDEPGPNESIHKRHTKKSTNVRKTSRSSERRFTVVMFGCTDQGQSVAVHCIQNSAHMYVGPFPDGVASRHAVSKVTDHIEATLPLKYAKHFKCTLVDHVDFVGINGIRKYVRIDCFSLKCFYRVRYMHWDKFGLKTFESNLDPLIKFLHTVKKPDEEAKGAFWINTSGLKTVETPITNCDREFWAETASLKTAFERVSIGRILQMSFDIESYTEDWKFGDNKRPEEYVFMISAIFKYYGDNDPVLRVCFVYNDKYIGPRRIRKEYTDEGKTYVVEVVYVDSRAELITAFFDTFKTMSPEVMTGWNIFGYDLHMLYQCAEKYGVWNYCSLCGKMKYKSAYLYHDALRSSGIGEFNIVFPDYKGCIPIDAMVAFRAGFKKYKNYKLAHISSVELKLDKKDITYNQMFWQYWLGRTDEIIEYNDYDSYLNMRLFDHNKIIINNVALCNLCGVALRSRYLRGKCYGIHAKIIDYSKKSNMIVPDIKKPKKKENNDTEEDSNETYGGGTVLDAKSGYYGAKNDGDPLCSNDQYVIVLDFTSLYPSVKIAYNLGHDTVHKGVPPQHEQSNYTMHTVNIKGVTHKVYVAKKAFRKSVLVDLLINMLNKRKEYQAEIKRLENMKPVDAALISALDSLQNEAKMWNNSEYGTTGSETSTLAHEYLAPLVTMLAGEALMKAIEITEQYFERIGEPCDIIYGDTDSLFIMTYGSVLAKGPNKPREYTPEELAKVKRVEGHPNMNPHKIAHVLNAIDLGKKITDVINSHFTKTDLSDMNIKYEKVYTGVNLFTKKRYTGQKFEFSPVMSCIETRGLESKRRETSPYVAKMLDLCNSKIFSGENYLDVLKEYIGNVENTAIDNLAITKGVKSKSSYKGPFPAHGVLVEKMRERDPTSAPQINERVAYVYQLLPFTHLRYNGKDKKMPKELIPKINKQYCIMKKNDDGTPKLITTEKYVAVEVGISASPENWCDVILKIEDLGYAKALGINIDYKAFMEKDVFPKVVRTIKQNHREKGPAIFAEMIKGYEGKYNTVPAFNIFFKKKSK